MAADTGKLSPDGLLFLSERHLATLTTLRSDGSPHVTPVGFTWDESSGLARVICSRRSRKARNAARGGPVALCQVDGRRWLTLEGTARVSDDASDVAEAVALYAIRYRQPRENPERVAVEITVRNLLGSVAFIAHG